MKSLSVTVGLSEEDLAIEACFERSMMSEVGKGEDREQSFSEHRRTIEQRDIESEESRFILLREAAADEDEDRQDAMPAQDCEQEMMMAACPKRRAEQEEEFEIVLGDSKHSSTFEGHNSDEQYSTASPDLTADEEGEEKIVVWCAEDDANTSSQSLKTESGDMHAIEEDVSYDPSDEMGAISADFEVSFDGQDEAQPILVESSESPGQNSQEEGTRPEKQAQSLSELNVAGTEKNSVVAGLSGTEGHFGGTETSFMAPEDELLSVESGKNINPARAIGGIPEFIQESTDSLVGPSIEWESDEERPKNQNDDTIGDLFQAEDPSTTQDDKATPSLSTLINKQNWSAVTHRVKEFSTLSEDSIEEQASLLGRDSLGNSFLHEICKNQPTVEVIQSWLQINKDDVQRPGIGGHLPLHFACAFGASKDVVDALVDAYPDSVTTPACNDNMLPLHLACREAASLEVLDFLLVAYPEAMLVQDKHGMTPMDYAVNIENPITRQQVINSVLNGLKQNMAAISEAVTQATTMHRQEQEKVRQLERAMKEEKESHERKLKDDQALLEYNINRVAALESADHEKKQTIENLTQKTESLESQLAETQLLLAAEKKRIFVEKTRELESALKIEQCKNSALEQSLVAKQEMVEHEKERAGHVEQKFSELEVQLENEKLKTERLQESLDIEQERTQCLQGEQASNLADEVGRLWSNPPSDTAEDVGLSMETARKTAIEQMRSEYQQQADENDEFIRSLEVSNSKKQEMLNSQQEKVEALERTGREKEALFQKNQEIMKGLEMSIERKLALQKTEEEKIRQLDILRHRKREMIESEEEQVRKLDYTLGRKQALLELEQMKEKTLQQTIAQKQALLESERSKVKELQSRCSEKESLLASEQNMVKALTASKKEKENLLKAERELVNELYRIHSEKEDLLKEKKKTLEEVSQTAKELEDKCKAEKDLMESAQKIRSEKEAALLAADETLQSIEDRLSKQTSLLSKEQSISESLEIFLTRRREIASKGALYSFVDATLSISHLVKEALLAKKYDQHLIDEHKPRQKAVVKKQPLPTSSSILRKALNLKGKGYIAHFAGFLGFSPSKTKFLR